MYRFSLTQLLLSVALVAIILTFVRSDGCGARAAYISCLAFSPDSSQLAIARHDARDANTPGKGYLYNVCRTVSILDLPKLNLTCVVEQDLKPGNQGPAFNLFGYVGDSLAFTDPKSLAVLEYGGGGVRSYKLGTNDPRWIIPSSAGAYSICLAADRTTVATGRFEGVDLWVTESGRKVRSIETGYSPFRCAPFIAFSPNAAIVVTADYESSRVSDANSGAELARLQDVDDQQVVSSLAFGKDNTRFIAATHDWVRDYKVDGSVVAEIVADDKVGVARLSPSGEEIAVTLAGKVSLFDLRTRTQKRQLASHHRITQLEYSPNGRWLAGGTSRGYVSIWDAETGDLVTTKSVPGRVRPPWTLPTTCLVVWSFVCWRLSIRSQPLRGRLNAGQNVVPIHGRMP